MTYFAMLPLRIAGTSQATRTESVCTFEVATFRGLSGASDRVVNLTTELAGLHNRFVDSSLAAYTHTEYFVNGLRPVNMISVVFLFTYTVVEVALRLKP
jgi:hypothetical protein